MRKLVWTEPALTDLEAIHAFIANGSEYYANSFLQELIGQAEKLLKFPEMGRIVPEYGRKDIRELIFQNYRIIYKLDEGHTTILTVIHGKRELLPSGE
ncbi:MAG: type II toxin-antitoxin system RelE/ParE family toxin [Thermoplasmata archaeon]